MKREQVGEDFSKIRESVTSLWTKGEVKGSGVEGHRSRRKPRGLRREICQQRGRSEPGRKEECFIQKRMGVIWG